MNWKKYNANKLESIKVTLEMLKVAVEKKRDDEIKKAEKIVKEIKSRGK